MNATNSSTTSDTSPSLAEACARGNISAVREYLKDTVEAEAVNDAIRTGVENGHVEVVRCLMEETQADVNTLTADRKSLLMLVRRGDVKMAEMLCQHGCDVNHVDCEGNTALIQVLKDCVVDEPVIDLFLMHGAHVNMINNAGDTSLYIAIDRMHCGVIEKLLAAGADVNLATPEFRKPLRHALRQIPNREKRSNICKLIIKAGPLKASEIHFPISRDETEIVEYMVDNGVLPGLRDIIMLKGEKAIGIPKYKTPLLVAMIKMNAILMNKFLDTHFLHENDLCLSHGLHSFLERRLANNPDCLQLLQSTYSSPWSLWTLCFVKISTCVGLESDRRDRISQTGLPQSLQNKLMFHASPKNN